MGYRIDYNGSVPEPSRTGWGRRFRILVAAAFLLFSVIVRIIWPEGRQMLQSVFLPVELSVTEQAFSKLVSDVRTGEQLSDAFNVFCRTVIEEAS